MASTLVDSNVRPHDRFFFSDGNLHLLVENSIYCVHRYLFEIHATIFPIRELETSLSKPYILGDVKKTDFDRLLALLYPRTLLVEETETTQDWISVLGLASKWGFESLRSRAISRIERTLDSPVDMVTLGRQYSIPAFLLPGYAVLCQSTVPLSDEEGLRLGIDNVLKIYRIRHELYGSGITPVSLEVAFAKVKEAGLGDERPRQELDGDQASTWTDVGSVAASQTSTEKEGGAITLTPDRHVDAHSPSDEPTSGSGALGNGGSGVPSSMFPGNVSNLDSESSESDGEGFKLLDELTTENFDLVSVEIMQWVNTKDMQTLHQIMRLTVEKAIIGAFDYSTNPYVRLCAAMVKYTQTMHQMTRLIVEKAMEESRQFGACAQLCNMMMVRTTADSWSLFSEYLGEICQENLETIAASLAAGEPTARVRRLRLTEFIGKLTDCGAVKPNIADKWVTALLDTDDEEKVATLCMAMTRGCRSQSFTCHINNWLQRVKNVAQKTSKPRVQKLLQGVRVTEWSVSYYNKRTPVAMTWVVAGPIESDCTVQ